MPRCAAKLRGFTLVELLVVIGIIALLIAILLPTISSARSQSVLLKCVSNVRSIMQGTHAYMAENRGYCPRGHTYEFAFQISGYLGGPMCGGDDIKHWESDPAWGNENILKQVQVYQCPAKARTWYLQYVVNNVDFDYYRATGQYLTPDVLAGVPNAGHQTYKSFPPEAA
jgi:prepilin-type N-terminal cleavage/methylation domain-containing protein